AKAAPAPAEQVAPVAGGRAGAAAAAARDLLNAVSAAFSQAFAWLVLVGILLLLVLLFNKVPGSYNVFQLILLDRYALGTAAALAGVPALGLFVAPSLLRSVFVLRGPWQVFHVAWLALLTAATVVSMSAVLEANAPGRYAGTGPIWPG